MSGTHTMWTVARPEAGRSILEFLATRLGVSRKRTKQLLDSRSIFVNQRRVWMARHLLAPGDRVELHRPVSPSTAPRQPVILYQDDDVLIVDKPAGMLANGPHSIESELNKAMPGRPLRAVHRLDRDTTGCLLFAKTEAAFNALLALFKQREVYKTYLAIASGSVPPTVTEIRKPIDGLMAVTRIRVIKARRNASFVELRLDTGRTHQARKHLAAIHHPLVGDKVYLTSEVESAEHRRIPRQMLHACALAFRHPRTRAMVRAQAALPRDFKECLAAIGLK